MFTNWLTDTTPNLNSGENRSNANGPPNSNPVPGPSHILMSTPPDVILEVGPATGSVRFVAHSIVLGMHSGYLRSAIRLDEQQGNLNARNGTGSGAAGGTSPDFILYLSNVTAEQFAPLLTYMYTGYLDLNVENIFGVLLATHVLHMPRALEICRAFLARAQTEGYLGTRLNNLGVTNPGHNTSNGKIIRPIPSKATLPNFGFLPALPPPPASSLTMTQQQQLLPPMLAAAAAATFKGIQRPPPPPIISESTSSYPTMMNCEEKDLENQQQQQRAKSEEIDVDRDSTRASSIEAQDMNGITKKSATQDSEDDDEDEEVFIDSSNTDTDNDDREVIIECRSSSVRKMQSENKNIHEEMKIKANTNKNKSNEKSSINKKDILIKKDENVSKNFVSKTNSNRSSITTRSRDKRRGGKQRGACSSSGLQIAKAPIPASQLDANEGSKVIIDVASCDGPVRFRRILNTAYGHKPEDFNAQIPPERSQQSVSYSFHQQMARTINQQQRQQMQQHHHHHNHQHHQHQQHTGGGEESENSESSGSSKHVKASTNNNNNNNNNTSNEIYVCVYCKHTFKSQYCYQKHAKRHLNPLSLNPSCSSERCDKTTALSSEFVNINGNVAVAGGGGGGVNHLGVACAAASTSTSSLPMPLLGNKHANTTDLLRREVRPLDMNVQYYPCKTCGSKFPSYYFVHKHRKMCHADEEVNVEKNNSSSRGQRNVISTNVQGDVEVEEKPSDSHEKDSNSDSSKNKPKIEN